PTPANILNQKPSPLGIPFSDSVSLNRALVVVFVIQAEATAAGLAEIALDCYVRTDFDFDDYLARLRCQALTGADIDALGEIFAAADRGAAGVAAAGGRVEVAANVAGLRRAEHQSVQTEPTAQLVEHAGAASGQRRRRLRHLDALRRGDLRRGAAEQHVGQDLLLRHRRRRTHPDFRRAGT